SATAVSGRRLARPTTFRFTTPTVQLLQTNWWRRDGTVNSPVVVALRFNQAVRSSDVAAHVTAVLESHEWRPPTFTPQEEARLNAQQPAALAAFADKVAAVQQVAAATGAVPMRLATSWDQRRFAPSAD